MEPLADGTGILETRVIMQTKEKCKFGLTWNNRPPDYCDEMHARWVLGMLAALFASRIRTETHRGTLRNFGWGSA